MRRRALLMGGKKKPLIIRIKTNNAGVTGATGFRIPTTTLETYKYDVDWGDGNKTAGHTGNAEHTYAVAGEYNVSIYGKFPRMFFANAGDRLKVLQVVSWGDTGFSRSQARAFQGCNNLSFIADDGKWFNDITNLELTFENCNLSFLPETMHLTSTEIAVSAFSNNNLAYLPNQMTFPNLTNGNGLFTGNNLAYLPDGMRFPVLTNGNGLFYNNPLASLPAGLEFPELQIASSLFRNTSLTDLPIGIKFPKITNGLTIFSGITINTARYSQLLIDMESLNPNNGVTFNAANSKYNSTAVTARANLVARGWTITDGGLE